ncbi:hypothetical protein ACWGA0_04375 [Streptomyces erythrochromogenes]
MIGWVRDWRCRRAAVQERVVVTAGGGDPLIVVFEPMGRLYEVSAGEYLTVGFHGRPGESGVVDHRSGYVSVCAASTGTMVAWTAAGAEIDLITGCPEATGPTTR